MVGAIADAGGRAIAVGADVAVESRRRAAVRNLRRRRSGRSTALVNNAGILETQMRVDDMDAARLERVFATNVIGAFLCAREAVRRMSTRHGGRGGAIVNVSSGAARLGSPGEYVDYAASKGALDTMTIGLAREVAEEGIRVNAVRPGFIYTEIHASGGEPNRVDRVKTMVPMKRGGTAPRKSPAPSCGCSPTRRRTRPARSSTLLEESELPEPTPNRTGATLHRAVFSTPGE